MSYYTTGIGAAFGKIVSGTKTVAVAGTAEQIISASVPIPGVWISGDTSNSGVLFIGDSSVNAIPGSQQGILIIPGNPPIYVAVNNLNLLWVDSENNGGKLCYAYLQPYY